MIIYFLKDLFFWAFMRFDRTVRRVTGHKRKRETWEDREMALEWNRTQVPSVTILKDGQTVFRPGTCLLQDTRMRAHFMHECVGMHILCQSSAGENTCHKIHRWVRRVQYLQIREGRSSEVSCWGHGRVGYLPPRCYLQYHAKCSLVILKQTCCTRLHA